VGGRRRGEEEDRRGGRGRIERRFEGKEGRRECREKGGEGREGGCGGKGREGRGAGEDGVPGESVRGMEASPAGRDFDEEYSQVSPLSPYFSSLPIP